MLKRHRTIILCVMLIFLTMTSKGYCDSAGINPPREELEQRIEQVAKKRGIPSVLLKAIVRVESVFQQYRSDGSVYTGSSGSIGLMQIYNAYGQFDTERLKYDIDYNIEAGAEVLLQKWSMANEKLPQIGDMNPNVLENWYFALWAYNGWLQRNNPNANLKKHTYQELIYMVAEEEYNQIITPIDAKLLPATGLPSKKSHYDTPQEIHYGDILMFQPNDIVKLDGRNTMSILSSPNGSKVANVNVDMSLEIIEGPSLNSGYFWYKVIEPNTGVEGWLKGNWITKIDEASLYPFEDIENIWSRDYILALHEKGIVSGEGENFNPSELITRQEMSIILSKALSLDGSDYELTYADANSIKSWAVEYVKAVSKAGLFTGRGEFNLFDPEGLITRQEAAIIISEIVGYEEQDLSQETIVLEYTDSDKIANYAIEAIFNVQAKGLMTGTNGEFRPTDFLTRQEACKIVYDILEYIAVDNVE